MIDIMDIEESILIEADDFGRSVGNLVAEIQFRDKDLSYRDTCRFACTVIGSLMTEGLIKVIKTEYKLEDEDYYTPVKSTDLPEEELDRFLKNPDQWDEMNVFSDMLPFELRTTGKGREKLEKLRGEQRNVEDIAKS